MNVYIHSSLKALNFGDELLALILIDKIDERNSIYINSIPGKTTILFDKHPQLRNINKKFPKKIDLLLFGGGGYFGSPKVKFSKWDVRFIISFWKLLVLKILKNPKSMIIGTGIGPNSFLSKRIIKILLRNNISPIRVRDEESKRYLDQYLKKPTNIEVIRDLASYKHLYPEFLNSKIKKTQRKEILIHNIYLKKFTQTGIEYLTELNKKGFDITIIADSEKTNKKIGTITKEWERIGFKISSIQYTNLEELLERITCSYLVITSKLHVGIVSTTFNIPTISIPEHIKTIRYHRSINNEEFCIEDSLITKEIISNALNKTYNHGNETIQIKIP
ncbi:polysaccharide pyruvyl transferase family protein [Nonlabens sp.]|uniref:polysaccharide pyruvyl transferase family protein n=1 Tax=Nonlabens sp. TaxID=1888209 RepID=UPI001BCD37A1|nr:polysaccharide pyruvyl transferase family protein [Nonlabens sp.]